MKKILALSLAILMTVFCLASCTAKEDVAVETFSEQNVEIIVENGTFVIKGSFNYEGALQNEYVVNCLNVKDGAKPLEINKKFPLSEGENTFEMTVPVTAKNQTIEVVLLAGGVEFSERIEKSAKSLRLLSVGNSFSVDAQQHLYGIAKDMGYDNIILGNLYIGGCSLEGHYSVYVNERNSYTYYKNVGGEMTEKPETSFMEGLLDEKWDYITLQQASPTSGKSESYEPYLSNLVKVIKQNKTNPNAEILWHMTWAYAGDSTYEHFKNYDYDQEKMYNCIVNATKENISDNSDIAFVIPSGTAIQNARNSELGDTLCRDGFHLDLGYGRYLASLTWMHKISGESIDNVTYIPDNMFDEKTLEILKEAAKNAVANPFEVTK